MDFDGYSNIAIGAAQILGYDLTSNFGRSYFSDSIKGFWRRWHISLSKWLKEYVYIPLGENRRGNRYVNLMTAFVVSGMWHGGEFALFDLGGGLHGCYQVVETIIAKYHEDKNNGGIHKAAVKLCRVLLTFMSVDFAWLFFRASDTMTAFGMLGKIF